MHGIKLPPLEHRLQKRYHKLVLSHMRSASPLAAGVASLPDKGQAFAAVQGAWRFHNNEHVTVPALLAGLWVLLSMSALLEHTDLMKLKDFIAPLTFPAPKSLV